MSVTFKAVLFDHHRKEDGTNFFRIRVTHQRKTRYIKTNICVLPEDYTRSGNLKRDCDKLDLVEDLVDRMIEASNEIDTYKLKSMTIDEVVAFVEGKMVEPDAFRLDFVEFGRKIADKKSVGTAAVYHTSLNALVRFFKGRHPDIKEITVRNLRKFEEFIKNEPVIKVNWRTGESKEIKKDKGGRSVSQYLGAFRHIYKEARKEFNDPDLGKFPISVDPFEYYSVPKIPAAKHRDISVETIQLMIDSRHQLEGRVRMAVDAFLISFGLQGMNAIDLFECGKVKGDILTYCRTKTTTRREDGAEMFLRVEECIRKIMDDYKDKERCFDYHRRYSNPGTFTTALNQGIARWCKKYKVDAFTFYSARHSWATIGRSKRCNIDKALITAGLCHVSDSKNADDVYIRLDWETVWDANAKILAVFDWK